jgi:hypothetical protein
MCEFSNSSRISNILSYITLNSIISRRRKCSSNDAIQEEGWKINLKRLTTSVHMYRVLFYKILGILSFLISIQTCINICIYLMICLLSHK